MKQLLPVILMANLLLSCGEQNDSAQTSSDVGPDSLSAAITPLSGWSVQLGAFSEKEKAQSLLAHLANSSLPAYLSAAEKTQPPLYRVRVGPFVNEQAASQIVQRVKALGYRDAFVVVEESAALPADSTLIAKIPDSLQRKQLTFEGDARNPQWSPTGREIAFFDASKNGIYTIGTAGGAVSRIIESNKQRQVLPIFAWSPSGRTVAFVAEEVNQRWEIAENLYLVNKGGAGVRKLLEQDRFAFKIANLQWSPGGQFISFDAVYLSDDNDLIQDVFILALNEVENENEENGLAKILEPTRGEGANWSAGWRHDQEFLFLSSYGKPRPGKFSYEIWRYLPVEKKSKLLHEGPLINNCQQVALFSNYLLYSSFAELFAVDLNSGKSKKIVGGDRAGHFSSDILRFAVTKDARILLLKNESLWLGDLNQPALVNSFPLTARDFSLSPSGGRICFEESGQLFTIKLP
jgi:dipeptidyl aminopeptidase/acylaminoacyl peptidase